MSHFSENQRYAVEQIQQSLVLTAGAGAGKTRVLVHRYLELLNHGYGLNEIVAITFTRKAAGEMRERIGEELLKRLQSVENSKEADQLQNWILLLPSANISTIHGFCSGILRQFPLEAKIDPNFKIIEEWESQTVLHKVITEALESSLEQEEPIAELLLRNKSVNQAVQTLQRFLQHMNNKGVPASRLADEWVKTGQNPSTLWQKWEEATRNFAQILFAFDKRGTRAIDDWKILLTLINETNQAWFSLLNTQEQEEWLQKIGAICESYQLSGQKSGSKNWQLLSEGIQQSQLGELLNLIWEDWLQIYYASALKLLQGIQEQFLQEKYALHCLDFSDLEHLTLQVLRENPSVLQLLRRRYRVFLIDEFQDTNYSQFELISLLNQNSLNQSLFVAGDVKQSIYGFRGAVVELFRKMGVAIDSALSGTAYPSQKNLETNYRSGAQIITLVNDYFSTKLQNYEPMLAARASTPEKPQLELLITLEASGETFPTFEAEAIAKRMQQMVTNQETLVYEKEGEADEQPRPVGYGDMAMLFRSRSDLPIYEAALKKENIPYLVVGNRAFYQREEIQDLLHGLAAVANPTDDFANWAWFTAAYHNIPLAALAEHALQYRNKGQSWLQTCWLGPLNLEKTWLTALHRLRQWQKLQAFLDIPNLLRQMIRDCQLETYYAAQPMGEQARTNLSKFITLAEHASGQQYYGIHECLYYFHQLAAEESEAELTLFAEGQNAVRIMTIHAAKGLEFPVLFLPDLIRKQDHANSDYWVWNEEHGLAFRTGNRRGNAIIKALSEADQEESQRIFYVAMTRARDYLVLCGGNHNRFKTGSWWAQLQEWLREDPTFDSIVRSQKSTKLVSIRNLPFRVTLQATKIFEKSTNPPNWEIPVELCEAEALPLQPLSLFPAEALHPLLSTLQEEIPIQPRPAVRVSATGLLNFRRCPRSYYLRYRMWLKDDPFDSSASLFPPDSDRMEEGDWIMDDEISNAFQNPLLFGSMVHRMCELITLESKPEQLVTEVLSEPMFRELASRSQEALELVKGLQENVEYRTMLLKAKEIWREWTFLTPIADGIYLEGVLDLMTEDANGHLHILDYKTNRIPKEPSKAQQVMSDLTENYRLQLQWYALAAEKLMGKPVASARLVFVRSNKMSNICCAPTNLETAQIQGQALTMQMELGRRLEDYVKNVAIHCRNCPYHSICLTDNERRVFFENNLST